MQVSAKPSTVWLVGEASFEKKDNPVWEKSEQIREREKYIVNSDYYVLHATPNGSACASLGPRKFLTKKSAF